MMRFSPDRIMIEQSGPGAVKALWTGFADHFAAAALAEAFAVALRRENRTTIRVPE
jgi:hypothetical protein